VSLSGLRGPRLTKARTFFCASFISTVADLHHKRLMMESENKQKFEVRFGDPPNPTGW
jgi:hypothetical protein